MMMKRQRRPPSSASASAVANTVLPSFPALRRRTLQTLYGGDASDSTVTSTAILRDKSPKGSVDEHIQSLVDCLNRHESYATLSSCSGRIALYDPAGRGGSAGPPQQAHQRGEATCDPPARDERVASTAATTGGSTTTTSPTISSGKGAAGKWLLVSHDEVQPEQLLQHFTQEESNSSSNNHNNICCSFRMEPLLLHVAACHLQAGQDLLQIAVNCGFRESGLVVTRSRVTVAIRTQSLALAVPLARQPRSPLRPGRDYLGALVREANRRLRHNWRQLHQLRGAIETRLFLDGDGNVSQPQQPSASVQVQSLPKKTRLPALNLQGHATVAMTFDNNNNNNNKDLVHHVLLVFGGYGPGPLPKSPARSSAVYSLACHRRRRQRTVAAAVNDPAWTAGENAEASTEDEDVWDAAWEEVSIVENKNNEEARRTLCISLNGCCCAVETTAAAEWGPRQGVAAVALQQGNSDDSDNNTAAVCVLFGGRRGPNQPLDDLLLFEYQQRVVDGDGCCKGQFLRPSHVQGQVPAPRWAHTLTSLLSFPSQQQQQQQQSTTCTDSTTAIPIALLVGGRNESTTQLEGSSVSLLSIVVVADSPPTEHNGSHDRRAAVFLWEPLRIDDPAAVSSASSLCLRFHHSAVAMDENHIFVLGGLSSVDDLLESFSTSPNNKEDDQDSTAFMITLNRHSLSMDSNDNGHPKTNAAAHTTTTATVERIACSNSVPRRFGHALIACRDHCSSASHNGDNESQLGHMRQKHYTMLMSGGVTMGSSDEGKSNESSNDDNDLQFLQLSGQPRHARTHQIDAVHDTTKWSLQRLASTPSTSSQGNDDVAMQFGCLVHHSCLCLPATPIAATTSNRGSKTDVVLVGGGVAGFAFQQSFAPSQCLSVHLAECAATSERNGLAPGTIASNSTLTDIASSSTSNNRPQSDVSSSHEPESDECDVLYVRKRDAKQLKTALEERKWLDKSRRMTGVVEDATTQCFLVLDEHDASGSASSGNQSAAEVVASCVAVPVTSLECISHVLRQRRHDNNSTSYRSDVQGDGWTSLVVGYGRQVCPPSTGVFARGISKK